MPTSSRTNTDTARKSVAGKKTDTTKTARRQRGVRREVDAKDRNKPKPKAPGAMQAGARQYPVPPFPKHHHAKPGQEWAIEPAPLYDAPFWQGSGKLKDKVALVTGGDSGIGRAVAVLFAREGADVAIVYLSEDRDAKATKQAVEAEGGRCIALRGDVAFTRALSGNLIGKGIRVNAVAPGPVWTPLNPSEKEAEDVSQFGARTPMKRPAHPEEIAPAYVFLASPQCSSYITGEILPIIGGY